MFPEAFGSWSLCVAVNAWPLTLWEMVFTGTFPPCPVFCSLCLKSSLVTGLMAVHMVKQESSPVLFSALFVWNVPRNWGLMAVYMVKSSSGCNLGLFVRMAGVERSVWGACLDGRVLFQMVCCEASCGGCYIVDQACGKSFFCFSLYGRHLSQHHICSFWSTTER